ncbi:unnamed protein product [Toxocara canis]|uniref:Protein-tyrosine-phosphatase n=1 Tax=Toxocara canis TaxID=6265 RepID=A0A183U197_TOXCA|nr:unnamed protein product [Toxocara canis]
MYWQYPNIAWMRMFPRIDGSQKLAGASRDSQIPSIQTIGPGLAAALVEQWTQAFEQLFHSWKKGTRSSFYLCCSSFTVLFLKTPRELPTEIDDDSTCSSWRVAGDCFRVIITPTTLGFREQLRDEGISYTMRSRTSTSGRSSKESGPAFGQEVDENTSTFDRSESQPALIIPDKQSDEQKPLDFGNLTGEAEEEESPNKLDRSDDSDNVAWLKDIGMSPASTRRLTKHLSMSSMSVRSGGSSDSGRSLPGGTLLGDDGGKSTVVISEPSSIQALFNLFNTSKICRPVTGPHAGLPPTLLSAQPFLHSTLSSLNKSSQIVKKGNEEMVYICELGNGPIMPHMIASVFEFVNNCPTINNTDNSVTLHVSGRSYCQGINQAIASEGFSDWNELVYRVAERNFYY